MIPFPYTSCNCSNQLTADPCAAQTIRCYYHFLLLAVLNRCFIFSCCSESLLHFHTLLSAVPVFTLTATPSPKEILDELSKKPGLKISDIATYDTFYETQEIIDQREGFEAGTIDCAVFTSASTVKGFVEATPGLDYTKVRAACIGKQTKAAADAYGMETYMAEKATIDSVLELVIKLKKKNKF